MFRTSAPKSSPKPISDTASPAAPAAKSAGLAGTSLVTASNSGTATAL